MQGPIGCWMTKLDRSSRACGGAHGQDVARVSRQGWAVFSDSDTVRVTGGKFWPLGQDIDACHFLKLCVAVGDPHQGHVERPEQVRPHRLVDTTSQGCFTPARIERN